MLLSRLLSDHGHAFTPFADDSIEFGHEEYSIEQGAALCCHGVNYDQFNTLGAQSTLTEFCQVQPQITMERNGLPASILLFFVGTLVAFFLWSGCRFCITAKKYQRKEKSVHMKH